jgi:hypothetical protein
MREKIKYALIGLGTVAASAVPVLAESGGSSGTANSAVVSAVTGVANDMVATGTAVIPIALTVVGITMVARYGIKAFRAVSP